jgi:hypothetical protein
MLLTVTHCAESNHCGTAQSVNNLNSIAAAAGATCAAAGSKGISLYLN